MSAEIESLTVESAGRRTGAGGSPTAVALAVVAVLLGVAAHWRVNRAGERVDGVKADLAELNELQQRSSERVLAVATQLETSSAAWRNELAGLRAMPAQLAELGRAVEELSGRTEAPQRGWARSEALYLLDLAQRRLELERDVRTAIVAMESADARLSTLGDPELGEVRRLIAVELGALRAASAPDLPQLLARIVAVEQAAARLPMQGVSLAPRANVATNDGERSGISRLTHRLGEAWRDLFSLRRIDPGGATLVTQESEALRRQHLELLLLGARTAAAQQDGAAYGQTLRAAREWLARYFDLDTPEAARIRDEIHSLAAIDVDPPRPAIGAAARALRRIVQGGAATP
jgi:uroporphyrin-III C-methyltransferase